MVTFKRAFNLERKLEKDFRELCKFQSEVSNRVFIILFGQLSVRNRIKPM